MGNTNIEQQYNEIKFYNQILDLRDKWFEALTHFDNGYNADESQITFETEVNELLNRLESTVKSHAFRNNNFFGGNPKGLH